MMKISVKFLSLLTAAVLMLTALASCEKSSLRPHDAPPPMQALFLYVGYRYNSTASKYAEYTDEDLQKLNEIGVKEVCINFGTPVVAYTPEGQSESQFIVDKDDVNSMSPKLLGPDKTESDLDGLKKTYTERVEEMDAGLTLESYADFTLEFANRLLEINPDIKIWYSFPDIAVPILSQLYIEPFLQYYEMMKERTGEQVWNNNIQGFYWSREDIPTGSFDNFDTENLSDFDNEMVKAMKACADAVHEDGKLTFWCPYYRPTADTGMPIGYIANQTDIFDYVILQPGYMFENGLKNNIEIVKQSTLQNAVLNNNGAIYSGDKKSSTIIGPEIEMQAEDFNGSDGESAKARYQAYVDAYKDMLGEYSIAFYCGSRPSQMDDTVIEYLEYFLNG
ncbi:MAG TPA: DUF4855 domain-containing protein [Firmicutes bacterium]|nr:DUF4855 domain-containing protein [Bacillota bacterium]